MSEPDNSPAVPDDVGEARALSAQAQEQTAAIEQRRDTEWRPFWAKLGRRLDDEIGQQFTLALTTPRGSR